MATPVVVQVFGANTDVGKTVVSAGVLRAAVVATAGAGGDGGSDAAVYIKPLQTGPVRDGGFVARYAAGSDSSSNSSSNSNSSKVACRTLFCWDTPVSPHLAAAKESRVVTDAQVVGRLEEELQALAATRSPALVVVETAGGVLSPGPSSAASTQADLYRPLRLPALLVGDGRLGGISATLAAYEALVSRGYDVHVIAILEGAAGEDGDAPLDNAAAVCTYIHETLGHADLPVLGLPALPPRPRGAGGAAVPNGHAVAPADHEDALGAWYAAGPTSEGFASLLATLQRREAARTARLRAMPARAAELFWYPFTQHRGLGPEQLHVVDSAYGDHYTLIGGDDKDNQDDENKRGGTGLSGGRRLLDACASWWTQGLGHGRADVALAVGAAAGRYGHVIFPGNVHEPALKLAELVLAGPGKGWATRVFFSDNGSTAMEIAVKMALKQAAVGLCPAQGKAPADVEPSQQGEHPVAVVTQRDCYHGDTLGCMDAAAPTVFNTGQHPWYVPRTLSLAVPTLGWVQGELVVELPPEIVTFAPAAGQGASASVPFPGSMAALLDVAGREGEAGEGSLAGIYRRAIAEQMAAFEADPANGGARLGAVLLEPVLMGAAGMILVDPLFQRLLVLEARRRGLPVVFDEVAAGLHRLGYASTCEILGVTPDIACYGKTLTGGYLPLALTLTTEAVFRAFQGPAKTDALLHGHSYTANPLACSAAVRALEAYQAMADRIVALRASFPEDRVAQLSRLPGVRRAVGMGTVLAVELHEAGDAGGYGSNASARVVQDLRRRGVYARPLGNVVYLLASQVASPDTTAALLDALEATLQSWGARGAPAGAAAAAAAAAPEGVVI